MIACYLFIDWQEKKGRKKEMNAWLITWDWIGEHAKVEVPQRIAGILNSRLSEDSVLDYVKFIYVRERYFLKEQIDIARNTNFWKEHFRLLQKAGEQEGIPLGDRFTLGQNPWLEARKVKNLKILEDGTVTWEEIKLTPEEVRKWKQMFEQNNT